MDIANGATDVSLYFVLRDSTTREAKSDVTVTDIDLYYMQEGAAMSVKADASALAAADSAHADNSAFNCGRGLYRVDWPDIWSGGIGKTVQLLLECAGVDPVFLEVQLSPPGHVASVAADAITDDAIHADAVTKLQNGLSTLDTGDIPTVEAIQSGLSTFDASSDTVDVGAVAGVAVADVADFKADVSGLSTLDTDDIPTVEAIQSGLSTLTAQQVWEYGTRTLSSFATLVADMATAVWGAVSRTLTAFSFTPSLHADYDAAKTAASQTSVNDIPTNTELAAALDALPTALENAAAVAAHASFLKVLAFASGKVTKSGNAYTFYAADGTTSLFTLTMAESLRTPS